MHIYSLIHVIFLFYLRYFETSILSLARGVGGVFGGFDGGPGCFGRQTVLNLTTLLSFVSPSETE